MKRCLAIDALLCRLVAITEVSLAQSLVRNPTCHVSLTWVWSRAGILLSGMSWAIVGLLLYIQHVCCAVVEADVHDSIGDKPEPVKLWSHFKSAGVHVTDLPVINTNLIKEGNPESESIAGCVCFRHSAPERCPPACLPFSTVYQQYARSLHATIRPCSFCYYFALAVA